jgi:hypothetical protein
MTGATKDACLLHAEISARQAIMKGFDRDSIADAFVLEAVKVAFGLEDAAAAKLALRWKSDVLRMLDADYVTHSADGKPRVVKILRRESRAELLGTTALTSRAAG